jgi:hypothetical protein
MKVCIHARGSFVFGNDIAVPCCLNCQTDGAHSHGLAAQLVLLCAGTRDGEILCHHNSPYPFMP